MFCGKPITEPYFKRQDRDCCAAMIQKHRDNKEWEKSRNVNDCDWQGLPSGPAFEPVLAFAKDEAVWLENYNLAWRFATENGHSNLKFIDEGDRDESWGPMVKAQAFDCSTIRRKYLCKRAYQCTWEADVSDAALAQTEDEDDADGDDDLVDTEEEEEEDVDTGLAQTELKRRKTDPGTCLPLP